MIIAEKHSSSGFVVPAGGAILYNGTSIPSGWTLETDMVDHFVLGCAVGSADNTSRGSAVHSHATAGTAVESADHNHSLGSDTSSTSSDGPINYFASNQSNIANSSHSHSIGSTTTYDGGGHGHSIQDTDNGTGLPPFHKLHWIKANSDTMPPLGGILIWNGDIGDKPAGHVKCDGANDTPDLEDKFVYGANGDGEVGDTGGSADHFHSNQNTASGGLHSHSYNYTSSTTGTTLKGNSAGGQNVLKSHDHSITGSVADESAHDHTIADTDPDSSLPPYTYLYFLQRNDLSLASLPVGVIIAWENAAIPEGWQICDGTNSTPDLRDQFVRGATADIDVGTTGGAETHTHDHPTATGTEADHNHGGSEAVSLSTTASSRKAITGSGWTTSKISHGHSGSVSVGNAGSHAHVMPTSTDAESSLPPHIKRAFIQRVEV